VAPKPDRSGGKTRRQVRGDAKKTHRPSEKAKREIKRLDQQQGVSAEMAAQLQAQWGNQAVAQLLDLPGTSALAATAAERRELGEEEEALLERLEAGDAGHSLEAHQGSGSAAGLVRGLPAQGPLGGAAPDRQYGGDDDDEPPLPLPEGMEGTLLRFDRPGRGNIARLQDLRRQGGLAPAPLETAPTARERAGDGSTARGGARPGIGDALFEAALEAWEDASLIAGRGCGIDDLQQLAGPYDALGRPMAAGAFAQGLASSPLGRSLSRLCATATGSLMPPAQGLTLAAARLGALAVLSQASDGLQRGAVRDRAMRIALAQAALELVLLAAGEVAQSVPPAHTLYRRLTGAAPGELPPDRPPGPEARHWVLPALCQVGQVLPLPTLRRWRALPPAPRLDPADPIAVVDAALGGSAADAQRARGVDIQPLLHSIDALLAAGGRVQVELATAALASRRPAFDGMTAAALRRCYRAFRAVALELLEAQSVLRLAQWGPREIEEHLLQANDELAALRQRMHDARERCLADLAVITELG
jgi:hypothetical protein